MPTLTLAAVDGAWSADVPPMVDAHDNLTLDWRQFQIPTDAGDGDAQLMLPDGTVVRRYTVREIPMVTTPPETDYPADVTLPGIGTVIGYDLAWDTDALTVTLVWRVADDPVIDRDYTVFVQLLNADNAVAAQSDSPPAGGARPTSGVARWRVHRG